MGRGGFGRNARPRLCHGRRGVDHLYHGRSTGLGVRYPLLQLFRLSRHRRPARVADGVLLSSTDRRGDRVGGRPGGDFRRLGDRRHRHAREHAGLRAQLPGAGEKLRQGARVRLWTVLPAVYLHADSRLRQCPL